MDAADSNRASVPASPLPSRPDGRQPTGSHRAVTMSDAAWEVPHEDDRSLEAVDWRARRGMRIAVENRAALGKLSTNVEGLNARIDAWGKRWDAWVARTLGGLKWASGVVGLLALSGAALWIWHFVSTLHH